MTSDSHLGILKRVLKVDEGIEAKPYVDTTGNITIGVGHNLSANGLKPRYIEWLLEDDIQEAECEAMRIFGSGYEGWSEPRKVAIVSLIFNLGKHKFLNFVNMIQAIRKNDWLLAGQELLDSKWQRDVDPKNIEGRGRDDRIFKMMVYEAYDESYKLAG